MGNDRKRLHEWILSQEPRFSSKCSVFIPTPANTLASRMAPCSARVYRLIRERRALPRPLPAADRTTTERLSGAQLEQPIADPATGVCCNFTTES